MGIRIPWYANETAFSALASTFRHQAADGVLFDGPSRQVLRFRNAQGGKGVVIAGWDDYAEKPMRIRVKTDATAAIQVDTMGNRRAVSVAGGVAVWEISANPSALRLEGAKFLDLMGNEIPAPKTEDGKLRLDDSPVYAVCTR